VLYVTTTTFSVRVGHSTKSRLERLARNTGRSRSDLAAEAIAAYLDTNEWQISGVTRALASLDQGKGSAGKKENPRGALLCLGRGPWGSLTGHGCVWGVPATYNLLTLCSADELKIGNA
jgi:predicted transcriptional regulator